jgi:hypothetical protein
MVRGFCHVLVTTYIHTYRLPPVLRSNVVAFSLLVLLYTRLQHKPHLIEHPAASIIIILLQASSPTKHKHESSVSPVRPCPSGSNVAPESSWEISKALLPVHLSLCMRQNTKVLTLPSLQSVSSQQSSIGTEVCIPLLFPACTCTPSLSSCIGHVQSVAPQTPSFTGG